MPKIDIAFTGKDQVSSINKKVENSLTELQKASLDVKKATLEVKAAQLENVQSSIKAKEFADQLKLANFELSKTLKNELLAANMAVKQSNLDMKASLTDAKIGSLKYNDALTAHALQAKLSRQANQDYEAALEKADKAQLAAAKSSSDAKGALSALGNVAKELKGVLGNFADAAKGAAGKVADLGSAATAGLGKLTALAGEATIGIAKFGAVVGAAAVAAGGGALKLASDYEQAFAQVKVATSSSERTVENFDAMEAAAVRIGIQTKFSAKEAALGLAELEQQGFNVKQSIAALDGVAQGAAINNVSMAESSKIMSVALNSFGLEANKTNQVLDVTSKAAQMGVLDFQGFGAALAAGGSVAKLANQSFEGFTSELLALTNTGQSAADSGTSLKAALLQLVSPGKEADSAIKELGLHVRDSHGEMLPFVDIVAQVERATKGMSKETSDFYLANLGGSDGIRAYAAALNSRVEVERDGKIVTLQGSEALRYYEQQLKDSGGTAAKSAAILQDTLGAKVENLKGSFEQFGITVGTALIPVAKQVVDKVGGVVNKLLEWETANHKISDAIADAADKAMGYAGKVGELYKQFSPLLGILNPLKIGFEVLNGVMTGGTMGGFRAVENQVVAVGKAFGVDLGPAMKTADSFIQEKVLPTFNKVASFLGEEVVPRVLEFGRTFVTDVLPKIGDALKWAGDKFGIFADFLSREIFPVAKTVFEWVGNKGGQLLSSIGDTLETTVFPAISKFGDWLGTFLWPKLKEVFGWVGDNFGPIFDKGFNILTEKVIPTIGKFVDVVLTDVIPTLGNWWDVLANLIKPGLEEAGRIIDQILLPVMDLLAGSADKNVDSFKGLTNFVNDQIIPAFKIATNVIHGTWMAMGGWAIEPVVNGIGTIIQRMNGATSASSNLAQAALNLKNQSSDLSTQLNTSGKHSLDNHSTDLKNLKDYGLNPNKVAVGELQDKHKDFFSTLIGGGTGQGGNVMELAKRKIDELSQKYREGKISPEDYKTAVSDLNQQITLYNLKQIQEKKFTSNITSFLGDLGKIAGKIDEISKKVIPPLQYQVVGPDGKITTTLTPPGPIQDYPIQAQINPQVPGSNGQIPKYATGTNYHPGGASILGDNRSGRELIEMPSGRNFLTTGPTLLSNLQRGSRVTPEENFGSSGGRGDVHNHYYYNYNVTGTFQAEEPEDLVTKIELLQMSSSRM